jgi:hypothetical protein
LCLVNFSVVEQIKDKRGNDFLLKLGIFAWRIKMGICGFQVVFWRQKDLYVHELPQLWMNEKFWNEREKMGWLELGMISIGLGFGSSFLYSKCKFYRLFLCVII